MKIRPPLFLVDIYSVITVQPVGIPLDPDTSQVADEFFTKVPVAETPESQFPVYVYKGVVVKRALI